MGRAREIEIKVIPSKIGNDFIKKHHYSGKVVGQTENDGIGKRYRVERALGTEPNGV